MWDELRPFPIDVTNMVHDAIEVVRPKLRLCSSFEEAQAAAVELEQECRSKIGEFLWHPCFVELTVKAADCS